MAGRTGCRSCPRRLNESRPSWPRRGWRRTGCSASVPTREVVVTLEQIAINAVMAGCRPEYMPVVVAAVRAHLHEKGNCHSTTGTLSGAAQVVIVNGPARQEFDINCTAGCFGPGWRANATIGRALRLVIRNVCRAIPNFLDRAPSRLRPDTPSASARTRRAATGCRSASSVASRQPRAPSPSHSMMTMGPATDFLSRTPEGVARSIARDDPAARNRGGRLAR